MAEIQQKYQQIYKDLIHAHRKFFLQKIVESSVRFLGITAFIMLIFLLINLLFNVADIIRQVFLAGIFLWFLYYTIKQMLPKLREIFAPTTDQFYLTAKRVGSRDQNVLDALINYLQIYKDSESKSSPIVKRLALEQLSNRFSHLSFNRIFSFQQIIKQSRFVVVSFSIFLIIFLLLPKSVSLAVKKIVLPWQNFQESLPIELINLSKSKTILKNEPVVLNGAFNGLRPEQLYLVIEDTTDEQKVEGKKNIEQISLTVPASGEFNYRLNHVRNSFKYYFLAEIDRARFRDREAKSSPGQIMVKERPMVRNLQVKIMPPSYSRLPDKLLEPNKGDITALKGSKAEIRIESDKQLSKGYVQFSDSSRNQLKIAGHTAEASFGVKKSVNYAIHIYDQDSVDNDQPVEYHVYPLTDEYPYAEIKQPGQDVDLGDELVVPLLTELRDDYGFGGAWLKGVLIRQGSSGDTSSFKMKLPYSQNEPGKALSQISWDLTSFYMVPDDYIQYVVEVWDNDRISGPKSYKTKKYTIRLPSLLDVMAQAEETQNEQLEKMQGVTEETETLKKKLEDINREMKKQTEMNWEQKQEIKGQLDKQKKAMEKLSEVQKELDEMVQKLDERKMLSPETLEKYFQLQKMFEKLSSEELKKAMKNLQQAIEKMNPQELQKQMQRFQFSVEEFERNINRSYELFKRIQLEQKMDELVRLSEKINQEQEKINQKLEGQNLSKDELKQLQQKENNLEKEGEYLEQKIGETNQDYQKLMKRMSEMLQKAESFMQEEQLNEIMQNMQKQLASARQNKAFQSGEQLKANLDRLQSMLQMARQNMNTQQKQELAEEMQKAMKDLLSASFEQEQLSKHSEELSSASSQINQVARKQSRLRETTNQLIRQLVEISNKTFFLSPGMNQMMNNLLSNMGEALSELEERNPRRAANAQMKAMANFNQALLSMQNSMNQMAQSSSASGFQEFMERLQKMAGAQGQLNDQTMQLFQKQQNGRLQLSSEEMGRLAAQQEMIRQSMEQLSQDMGNRRDVLGRLGELGGEMEEIVKELKEKKLDRKVIERQQRILSRLLDAQKSVREKEYSKKRKAEREDQKLVNSPPELKRELLQREDELRKELMRALEEGYTPEYRELIKLYFETLSREPAVINN